MKDASTSLKRKQLLRNEWNANYFNFLWINKILFHLFHSNRFHTMESSQWDTVDNAHYILMYRCSMRKRDYDVRGYEEIVFKRISFLMEICINFVVSFQTLKSDPINVAKRVFTGAFSFVSRRS